MILRQGLRWEELAFSIEPRWTREPDIKILRNIASKVLGTACAISFFSQGGFNKLYLIECKQNEQQRQYLIRVSLPVDPTFKTLSEVNTIAWLRSKTSIPVPTVLAYDCSYKNELGFEWILMEKIPGKALGEIWGSLSMTKKKELVKEIVRISAELFSYRFTGIGSLYSQEKYPSTDLMGTKQKLCLQHDRKLKYGVGRMILMKFFWDKHYTYNIARGPFDKTIDWLTTSLSIDRLDCEQIIQQSTDEDEIEEAEESLSTIDRVLRASNSILMKDVSDATALFHDDLSTHNILIDDDGELKGVVDWECTPVVPLWRAAQLPAFLMNRQREVKPTRETYGADIDELGDNSLYNIHLREYEITQLRNVFLEEMRKVSPEWTRIFNSRRGKLQADLDLAVSECGPESLSRLKVDRWLDSFEKGKEPGPETLYARIMGCFL